MESTQLRAEIKVIFKHQLDDDVGIRLQEFYLCDETPERELPAVGVVCSIYDRNCLAVRIEQEDEAMDSEPRAALSLFEETVLEEIGFLIRFARENKYRIQEVQSKIYSSNQLLLASNRASVAEPIRARRKRSSVLRCSRRP